MDELLWLLKVIVFPGFTFVLLLSMLYEWIERKLYARFQHRMGPAYVGPFGLLQPLADVLKLLLKEDIVPEGADHTLFTAAPILSLTLMLFACLLLPIADVHGVVSFEGDLILALALLTFYAVTIFTAGCASANRFAIIGSERAALQLVGYEIPLGLTIIAVAVASHSLSIGGVVEAQRARWLVFGPDAIGFAVFLMVAQAELERQPFDIPDAEQEIVAGWRVEYTGRRLAFFRMANDLEMVYLSGLAAALFLGGPLGPLVPGLETILHTVYFVVKSVVVLFISALIRASVARLKIGQMLSLSWRYLVPLSMVQLIIAWVM